MTTFLMMEEGVQEMLYNTALEYVDDFMGMEEAEQDSVLGELAELFINKAKEMGYELDATTATISGLDEYEETAALECIENALDAEGWKA